MDLSKTTQYAFRILALMVEDPKRMYSSAYLYSKLKIPKKYLQRLLTDLSKNGLIKSAQGRSGGFMFAKKINTIFLSDIVEAVEAFQKEPTCFFGFETCPMDDHCSMHEVWAASQDEMIKILSKTKLIDVKFDNIKI